VFVRVTTLHCACDLWERCLLLMCMFDKGCGGCRSKLLLAGRLDVACLSCLGVGCSGCRFVLCHVSSLSC